MIDDDATRKFESSKQTRNQSFDSIDDARFVPGTILAARYRIVGLLGKGGMGEVYRADDLKLSQPVALKFLPDSYLSDGAALARFHREVRVARQVSHRNVCRVYDIGEIDGRHFLSMEFIKGEELSSLLRRIGRLPSDKAVQIARQICAGLAAAHEAALAAPLPQRKTAAPYQRFPLPDPFEHRDTIRVRAPTGEERLPITASSRP